MAFTPRHVLRLASLALVASTLEAVASAQQGEPSKMNECLSAYPQAQILMRDMKLRAARTALLTCAQDACPAAVRRDCLGWLDEVERRTPSVVVLGRDKKGSDTLDVRVLVDGEELVARLTSAAIPLDPGEHTFRFEHDGTVLEQRVVLREGEQARKLKADFAPPAPEKTEPTTPPTHSAEEPRHERPTPVAVYVLSGIGIVGLGTFGGFAVAGYQKESDLRDSCGQTGSCGDNDVNRVKRRYLIGDIGLAVGVASLGTALVLYLTRSSVETSTIEQSRVDVAPVHGGAVASFRGNF